MLGRRSGQQSAALSARALPRVGCEPSDPPGRPQPGWADHRALVELLENGSPNGDEGGGELYTGGKIGWVRSVTSIASPHNGTTLRDAVLDFVPRLSLWVGQIARLAGGERAEISDFGLQHFGAADRFWQPENHDSAQWELGPDGAREFNAWAKTSPNVYYYSIGASATEAGTACCWFGDPTDRLVAWKQNAAYQYARTDMTFFLKPTAGEWVVPPAVRHGMGAYTQAAPGRVPVDASWFQNDGVVNTVSMKAPAGHPVREYDGNSVRGSWNYIKTYQPYDHFDIIGWPNLGPSAYPVYDGISTIIFGL